MPSLLSFIHARHYPRPGASRLVGGLWYGLTALPQAIYGVITLGRDWAYQLGWLPVVRLPVPVVSVGNLTTGGTGKTPVVIALARALVARGLRVVILSRGYGARRPQRCAVADHPDFGDEAYLMAQSVPQATVIVGRNRQQTGAWAVAEFSPDVVILDDGFQYRGLARTVDWVLVDAVHGLGNRQLLPTGPLREPLTDLKRATTLLYTRSVDADTVPIDLAAWLTFRVGASLPPAYCVPFQADTLIHWATGERVALARLAGQAVVAVSGLAQPGAFEASLRAAGAQVVHHQIYPDHHPYEPRDFEQIGALLRRWPDAWLVTTAKDWVKWEAARSVPWASRVWCLEVAPELPPVVLDSTLQLVCESTSAPSG